MVICNDSFLFFFVCFVLFFCMHKIFFILFVRLNSVQKEITNNETSLKSQLFNISEAQRQIVFTFENKLQKLEKKLGEQNQKSNEQTEIFRSDIDLLQLNQETTLKNLDSVIRAEIKSRIKSQEVLPYFCCFCQCICAVNHNVNLSLFQNTKMYNTHIEGFERKTEKTVWDIARGFGRNTKKFY